MKNRIKNRHEQGFSLIEMIVVGAVLITLAVLAFPSFSKMKKKIDLVSSADEVRFELVRARQEAMKSSFDVVVEPIPNSTEMVAWVNVDDDADYAYNANNGDRELFRFIISNDRGVTFSGLPDPNGTGNTPPAIMGQGGNGGNGGNGGTGGNNTVDPSSAISGFELVGEKRLAVFDSLGSVTEPGAIRLNNGSTNVLEVFVQRTGNTTIRKYNPTLNAFVKDGTNASGRSLWEW